MRSRSQGDAWIQLDVFLLSGTPSVILIFDVEAVFLLAVCPQPYSGLSLRHAWPCWFFLLLLVEGLVWACKKAC